MLVDVGCGDTAELGEFPTEVGTASTGVGALALAVRLRPDVIMLNLRLPDMGGLEVLRQLAIRGRCPRVVVFTRSGGLSLAPEALALGAVGYLECAVEEATLTELARIFARPDLFPDTEPETPPRTCMIEHRELDIIKLVAQTLHEHKTSSQIEISVHTLRTHRGELVKKLRVQDRARSVRFSIRTGRILEDRAGL